jgi:hypothetical protein
LSLSFSVPRRLLRQSQSRRPIDPRPFASAHTPRVGEPQVQVLDSRLEGSNGHPTMAVAMRYPPAGKQRGNTPASDRLLYPQAPPFSLAHARVVTVEAGGTPSFDQDAWDSTTTRN